MKYTIEIELHPGGSYIGYVSDEHAAMVYETHWSKRKEAVEGNAIQFLESRNDFDRSTLKIKYLPN